MHMNESIIVHKLIGEAKGQIIISNISSKEWTICQLHVSNYASYLV